VVVVQHTHCPGCYEEYQNAYIVYGQGNLIFDRPNKNKPFYEGFLVKLSLSDDFTSTMDLIPYFQSDSQVGARKMNKHEEQLFLKILKKRSIAIKDDAFVQARWLEFCENKKYEYLSNVLGHNRFFKKLNKNGLLLRFFYKNSDLVRLGNVISCEAHREVLETIFNQGMI